jgi:hypothetical protein
VQIGDGNIQHNYFVGRAPVVWPVQVGVVPRLADGYQARRIRAELDRSVADGATTVLTQVLSGLGGVGKTQLAVAYAQHVWARRGVDLLVWITAATRQAISAGYAQAAADVLAADDSDAEQAADRFLAWLAATDRRWLIVLDDLQEPAALNGLWPPTTLSGTVLITTRRRDAALTGAGRRLIDVGLFTPDEAVGYLRDKLTDQPLDQAEGLAADLGYLPLALAQAVAYMSDRGLDGAAYRQRLADRRKTLAELVPEPGALPDEHRTTVDATWSLSVDAADQLHPTGVARPVLELSALLDPNGIPTGLFTTVAAREYLGTNGAAGTGEPVDSDLAADALHHLGRFNLVTLDPSARSVQMHALVQRATRDRLTPTQLHTATRAAADALIQIWPVGRDPSHSQMLRANSMALQQHGADPLWAPNAHPVLFRTGHSLDEAGLLTAAIIFWRQLSVIAIRMLGSKHPDTLAIRRNVAWCEGDAGDPTGALRAYEQILVDSLDVLGPDHPQTMDTRRGVAWWQGEAGDITAAIDALEDLLTGCLQILGPDHPDTLATRADLARRRGEAGDPHTAADAFHRLLADLQRVCGPDHPQTLYARGSIARFRCESGDPTGAAAAYEHLLTDRLRVFGPDHPMTLETRHNIAWCKEQAGDLASASRILEELVTDQLRVLGQDHPQTHASLIDLAQCRHKVGDASGAVVAMHQVLASRLRVLGTDHPDTLAAHELLASWRDNAGN